MNVYCHGVIQTWYLVLKEKDVVHSTESYDKFMGLFLKKKKLKFKEKTDDDGRFQKDI